MSKCCLCESESGIKDLHIVENTGFSVVSKKKHICYSCLMNNRIETEKGLFIVIDNKMYHRNEYDVWNLIVWEEDIKKIFNADYYRVLNTFKLLRGE